MSEHPHFYIFHVPMFPFQVFQKLDSAKNGTVTQTNIQRFYRHDSSDMEGVWFDHTHKTSLHSPITTINYAVSSIHFLLLSVKLFLNVSNFILLSKILLKFFGCRILRTTMRELVLRLREIQTSYQTSGLAGHYDIIMT